MIAAAFHPREELRAYLLGHLDDLGRFSTAFVVTGVMSLITAAIIPTRTTGNKYNELSCLRAPRRQAQLQIF
jgi:hypothetical protein